MMLRIIFVSALVFAFISALAVPIIQNNQSTETQVNVVKFENQSNRTGKYSVIYELSNGIIHYETGTLYDENHDRTKGVVEGTYWFVGPDNRTYKIEYFVNRGNFQPIIGGGSGVNFNVLRSAVG